MHDNLITNKSSDIHKISIDEQTKLSLLLKDIINH